MIATLLMAVLAQAPSRDARPSVFVTSARIVGIVTTDEPRPRPLRRVRVTVTDVSDAQVRTAITNDDGTFAFDVAAGRLSVTAAKPGYVSTSYGGTRPGRAGRALTIAAGEVRTLTLRLPRGAVVTGTVYDVDGEAARGISVTALALAYFPATGGRRARPIPGSTAAVTDDLGVYRIYGLRADEYVIAARPSRPAFDVTEVQMMRGGQPLERHMAAAIVYYPGSVDLSRAQPLSLHAAEERAGVDLQLQYVPLAKVSGIIAGGAAGTVITLARTDESGAFENSRTARLDQDGRFTFSSVPPGAYRVTAVVPAEGSRAGGSQQWAAAEIAMDGEDIETALTLRPALTIAGHVSFEGRRAPVLAGMKITVPITLSGTTTGRMLPPLVIEADGTFRVDGVIPGTYRALGVVQGVRAPIGSWWLKSVLIDGREVLDRPLDLQRSIDGVIARFGDEASEIAGTVRDASGAPIPEITVVVFSVDREGWFLNSRRVAALRPGADGRYAVRNLPPGEYRVAAADLDQNEWFDPLVLERLLPASLPLVVEGVERKTVDLIVR